MPVQATYTDGGVSPIDRLRSHIGDTVAASAVFSDAQLYAWLDQSLALERLRIYLPEDNEAGATSATARVLMSGASLVLQLQRTGVDGSPDTITLAPTNKPFVGDLHDAIRALDKEWEIGIGDHKRVEWLSNGVDDDNWRDSLIARDIECLALFGRSGDLALQRQGTLVAFGDEDTAAHLHFYDYGTALAMAGEAYKVRMSAGSFSRASSSNASRRSSSSARACG